MSTLEFEGIVTSFAIFLCVPDTSTSIVVVASLSVTFVILIILIFKTLFEAAVTKVVVRVVERSPTCVVPRILATDTIFGAAIFYFLLILFIIFFHVYPKTIAAAIAFPIDIPVLSAKLNVPEPSVTNYCFALPALVGSVIETDPNPIESR